MSCLHSPSSQICPSIRGMSRTFHSVVCLNNSPSLPWCGDLGNFQERSGEASIVCWRTHLAPPSERSLPTAQCFSSQPAARQTDLTMEDVLRECIELCAQVADRHAARDVAQSIRKLKPPSRWP